MMAKEDALRMGAGTAEIAAAQGLTLSHEQLAALEERRKQALRDSGRVEWNGGILPRLLERFTDSPHLHQAELAETLERLQALFYHWKNEVGDLTPDETVLRWLRRGFDRMGGDMSALEGFSPLALQRQLKEEADERI